MSYEQYANNAQTTTTGAINNTSNPVTFSVTSATNFPTSGNFRVLIDSEIMLVTAVSGTSFTASRAQESTSIASHSSGATVTCILTAGSLLQLPVNYALSGTYASLPSAGVAGRIYRCTDSGYTLHDNGTTWDYYWGGFPVTPPPATGWTWGNQGSATVSFTTGTLRLLNASGSGTHSVNSYYKTATLPSPPYTIVWGFNSYNNAFGNSYVGALLTNTTYIEFAGIATSGGGGGSNLFQMFDYSTYSSSPGNLYNQSNVYSFNNPLYIQMVNDGTHRTWSIGPTPFWFPFYAYQEAYNSNYTPTNYGVMLDYITYQAGLELFHLSGP